LTRGVQLTHVFRQARESAIVTNAARIRSGAAPLLTPPLGERDGLPSDCIFVSAPGRVSLDATVRWAVDELPHRLDLDPRQDVQVLTPLTRRVSELNARLQAKLNPRVTGSRERPGGGLALRLGDRVMQTVNNYQLEVFNGETGQIVALDEQGGVTVDYEDRRIAYGVRELYQLDHAYAITIHRSQGSEWPAVVVMLTLADAPLLSRPLLYTALTRAKRCAVLIGQAEAFALAAGQCASMARHTSLAALLGAQRTDSAG